MDGPEHVGHTLQKGDGSHEALLHRSQWRKHAAMTAAVCIAIIVSTAALLYHIAQQLPEPDHFPAKRMEELLEAIRPQILEPESEK